ncbi:MAG: PA2778 family cysteine peptidase [Candidatus Omnitrophica bacterium]|nr:PA2778 family cysteine peptidase [Candidatus Omnitrophota bacterium]
MCKNIEQKKIVIFLTAVVLLVNGCATAVDISRLEKTFPSSSAPTDSVFLDVPFVKQKKNLCGPAALSSMLAYWGYKTSQEEIAQCIFKPDLGGVLNFDLEHYAAKQGLWARGGSADFSRLKQRLQDGVPVIVMEKLHPYFLNRRHYVVIVGFNDKEGFILEHTGRAAYIKRSYNGFLRNWQQADSWMLEVMPPDLLNKQELNAEDNIRAGILFEQQGENLKALEFYKQAKIAEPDNPVILFDIANVYVKLDNLKEAESFYKQALEKDKNFAYAYNNLADVYRQRKEFEAALETVDKAIPLAKTQELLFYCLDTKAQIFFDAGDSDQAREFFKKARLTLEIAKSGIDAETQDIFNKNWQEQLGF